MKKKYDKPVLYAETFELLEHVASCFPETNPDAGFYTANYRDSNDCTYSINNDMINVFYNYTTKSCSPEAYTPDEDGFSLLDLLFGDTCYNTFNNTSNMFAS